MMGVAREIVIGRNSALWQALYADPRLEGRFTAIGHAELARFVFAPGDRIWVLAYGRDLVSNQVMFDQLAKTCDIRVVYVSTATTNVDAVTKCFQYPRIKRSCEQLSQTMLNAHILTIGVVYRNKSELPSGTTMATSVEEIAAFIAKPNFPEQATESTKLFSAVTRPFSSILEHVAYDAYGTLQHMAHGWPCLLRPIDVILRALGWRWYGYLYLSNRLYGL